MQDSFDYTYNGDPVTLKSTKGGFAVIALTCEDGHTDERLVPVASLKPIVSETQSPHFFEEIERVEYQSFTAEQAVEFVSHLGATTNVVETLTQKIAALEAELEAKQAKHTQRIRFYDMVNTLDLHRNLLMAAQGDRAVQVHVIALIVRALEAYVATLTDGDS